jgi:shikimate dehydrogenase
MGPDPTACVIGWPVGHSRSPLIHRYWLEKYRLAGDYVARPVPPEEIDAFLAGFADSGFIGANVTIPHKQAAFRAATEVSPVATALQAANTLWLRDGILHADNTDCHGFLANLDEQAPGWDRGGAAIVFGAGGAARAIIYALIDRRFDPVIVLNRTAAKADKLARHFGSPVLAAPLSQASRFIPDANLFVNTTSAGMDGAPALDIDWSGARVNQKQGQGAFVTDIVYTPLQTPFLRAAAGHGLKTVDGLGMLLHQAVPGFERWFGVRPAVDEALRRIVLADITGQAA